MAWQETDRVRERQKFLEAYSSGRYTLTALCASFGVSRSTAQRLVRRFRSEGSDCVLDRSRAPVTRPTQTPREVESAIVQLRLKYRTWGSKKILAYLQRHDPDAAWPARSTVDAILKREGLVPPRPNSESSYRSRAEPIVSSNRPNAVWTADFKGWFRLGDGSRCEPLTINDMFSRFALACRPFKRVAPRDVQKVFEECFQEYGLPVAVLTDNGPPFGSSGRCGLTWLSVWLLRLGVLPSHIQPGKPQQNSKHERYHRTLKIDAASPPKATWRAQERAIHRFRQIYNHERPHEALGMRTPADVYERSPRPYKGDPGHFSYPPHMKTTRIRVRGHLNWKGTPIYVGEAMANQLVGLEPRRDDVWRIWLGHLAIGDLDMTKPTYRIRPIRKRDRIAKP